jgi:hypothetical protein
MLNPKAFTRRQKLIWFGTGVFSAASVYLAASLLLSGRPVIHEPTIHYLILEEPPIEAADKEYPDSGFIADRTGKLMRDCGARYFETTALFTDHASTAEVPMVGRNSNAIECILKRANEAGINVRIDDRRADPSDLPRVP